jgi:hypothetical protein
MKPILTIFWITVWTLLGSILERKLDPEGDDKWDQFWNHVPPALRGPGFAFSGIIREVCKAYWHWNYTLRKKGGIPAMPLGSNHTPCIKSEGQMPVSHWFQGQGPDKDGSHQLSLFPGMGVGPGFSFCLVGPFGPSPGGTSLGSWRIFCLGFLRMDTQKWQFRCGNCCAGRTIYCVSTCFLWLKMLQFAI